jgi:hypothetical protein
LTEIVKGVSTKSIEQWKDTKSKTVNLYHFVLNRIKEKEIEIKTEYVKDSVPEVMAPAQNPPSEGNELIEMKELTANEAEN